MVVWAVVAPATALALKPGDILVANQQGASIIAIDAITGAQSEFSPRIPGGAGFGDVTVSADGGIFATHSSAGIVYRIDNTSGASVPIASGGLLQFPSALAIGPGGAIWVVVGGSSDGLVSVDESSGAQSLIATGLFRDILISPAGTAYVTMDEGGFAYLRWRVYRIDLFTGVKALVSSFSFHEPTRMTFDASGGIIVPDAFHDPSGPSFSAFRVDPTTGSATLLGSGSQAMAVTSIEREPSGSFILADYQHFSECAPPGGTLTCPGAVYRMSSTGALSLLSSGGGLSWVGGVDIYRGPDTTPTVKASWSRVKSLYR